MSADVNRFLSSLDDTLSISLTTVLIHLEQFYAYAVFSGWF